MAAGDLAGEQPDGGFAGRGDFATHVFRPNFQIHQVVFAIFVFPDDFTFAKSGIADNIRQADFDMEFFQESVVAHPVGQCVADPAYSVGAVIISGMNTQFPGNVIIRIDAGNRLQSVGGGMMEAVGWDACADI